MAKPAIGFILGLATNVMEDCRQLHDLSVGALVFCEMNGEFHDPLGMLPVMAAAGIMKIGFRDGGNLLDNIHKLFGSVNSVTGVTQTRQNIGFVVELTIKS